jgi:hypothetical protein
VVYLKVNYRLAFVDSGALGRGCAYSFPGDPNFTTVVGGFTFTVG